MPTTQPLRQHRPGKQQRGTSLIEVLVVLVLVTIGMLGLIGLQARTVQAAVNAEDSMRAAALANEIASTMWVRNTVTLPAATVTTWQDAVADGTGRGLPNGQGAVTVTGNVARVEVSWRPPNMQSTDPANRYVTEVLIP
jgi:type IV pilus assembly protein PilV